MTTIVLAVVALEMMSLLGASASSTATALNALSAAGPLEFPQDPAPPPALSGPGSSIFDTPSIPVGSSPWALAVDPANGDIYTANYGTNNMSVIQTKTAAPSARDGATITYDAKDGYVLLFGGSDRNDTWKYEAGAWTELFPVTSPPGSFGQSMTYDAKDGYVVLFDLNQTWKFSGGVWTRLSPSISPPERFASTMTYDAKDGYVVLFGGVNPTGAFLSDSWKFLRGKWTKIVTATHPSARAFMAMTYDSADGYILMFGGCHTKPACTTGYFFDDSWAFVGGAWTKLSPTAHPSARAGQAMAYDAKDGYVLLFGGCDSSNCSKPFSDTWTFVGGQWTPLKPSHHPSPRVLSSEVYDPKSMHVLLFGGGGPLFSLLNDTWQYAGGKWTKV